MIYLRLPALPLCHLGFASMPGVNLKQILREISSQNLTRVRSGVLPLGEITKRWRNISSPMSQAVFFIIYISDYLKWLGQNQKAFGHTLQKISEI